VKLKPLLFAVGSLAVVAAIGWWLSGKPAADKDDADNRAGQNLLAPDVLSKTRHIVLSKDSGSESAVLQYDPEGMWTLPDYYGLRVDFSKLQSLTRNLLDARIRRLVSRNPDRLSRLELGNSRIVFQSEAGETIWDLEIGKRGPSGGYFVRYNGEEAAYIANLSLYLDAGQENWADKKILPFDSQDVSAIEIKFPDTDSPIPFHRENAEEDFQSPDLPENQSIINQELKNLINSLVNARFVDATGPDEPDVVSARANTRKITLKLFQGDAYTLAIGRRPPEPVNPAQPDVAMSPETAGRERSPAQPDVAMSPETAGRERSLDEEEESQPEMTNPGPVYIFYECSDPDNRINKIMKLAAFSYSNYLYSQLPESQEDLIDTVNPQEPLLEASDAEKEPEK